MLRTAALAATLALACSSTAAVLPARRVRLPAANTRGAAVVSRQPLTLALWGGDGLWLWWPDSGRARRLAEGKFAEGGCIVEIAGGVRRIAVQRGAPLGDLIAVGLDGSTVQVDDEVEMHDCMEAHLLGHRGILVNHRYAQLRLYEPGSAGGEPRWPYREVYSVYTPSRQGGLGVRDVDADGLSDILYGNYWVRSPRSFDLPWELFAINAYTEEPGSALLRLGWMGDGDGSLIVAQAHVSPARVTRFEPPDDPRRLWIGTPLAASPPLRQLHGLLVLDSRRFLVAENAGAGSRIVLFDGVRRPTIVAQNTGGVHTLLRADGRIWAIGARRAFIFSKFE